MFGWSPVFSPGPVEREGCPAEGSCSAPGTGGAPQFQGAQVLSPGPAALQASGRKGVWAAGTVQGDSCPAPGAPLPPQAMPPAAWNSGSPWAPHFLSLPLPTPSGPRRPGTWSTLMVSTRTRLCPGSSLCPQTPCCPPHSPTLPSSPCHSQPMVRKSSCEFPGPQSQTPRPVLRAQPGCAIAGLLGGARQAGPSPPLGPGPLSDGPGLW